MKRVRRWLPSFLLVLPSIILVGVFVYGFIGKTVFASLARVKTKSGRVKAPGGWANYSQLLADGRYQHAMWNLLVLTVVFVAGTMVFGLLWALLLEKGVSGEGFFRSIFLFPMAVSFVAAGVIWRWLLSPAKDGQAAGLNQLFVHMGMSGLQSSWYSSGKFNMAAMAIPAIWQLSGYIMALFLAGFRGISEDQREAARVDGAYLIRKRCTSHQRPCLSVRLVYTRYGTTTTATMTSRIVALTAPAVGLLSWNI